MVAYIDSSVVLRHILNGGGSLVHAQACTLAISSELLEIECRRVLHRCRLQAELDDARLLVAMDRLELVLAGIELLGLTQMIKRRAMESFPTTIKTLDALHLSSILAWSTLNPSQAVLVFSHNHQFNACARALGFQAPLHTGG